MIQIFALSCFVLALVYGYSLTLYRKNGPSKKIGRFSNIAVIVFGLHLLLALTAMIVAAIRHDGTCVVVTLAVILSPPLIARVLSFRQAGWAIALQILVLTTAGVWLTVAP